MTDPPARFTHEGVPTRIVFGIGSRHGLADELDRLGLSQVVLIASGSSRAEADALVGVLDHRLTWRVDGVRQHVPAELAAEVTADAIRVGADGVVTLGGGSATGLGKAVALSGLPLVAVPTTYAGSEMTPVWGVTTDGRKETGRDPQVLPKTVLYDPELTFGLPPLTTAASGMNALAHCLEALWAAGASPLAGPLALDGARTLCEAVPAAVAEPWDAKVRGRALVGACQAGMALATAGTGLHHRLCHVLGGRYDLPHAQTHAALLPHVVGFNEPVLGALAARMAIAVGSGRASTGVHDLAVRMGLCMALSELGMPESAIEEVAAEVAATPPPNPRPVDEAALRSLLRAAWEGDSPG
ncbi:MAG: maleylacetate reductase [Candidatus Binatota bacterium]|nr:maleylacetate reductase [Candidatus Binatota bacterium]